MHRTRTFSALHFTFCVESDNPSLARHLDDLFGCLSGTAVEGHRYSIRPRSEDGQVLLLFDDELVKTVSTAAQALSHLLWDINRQAVAASSSLLLTHAAAAEKDGAAVIISAPTETGKTTLVTALMQSGLGYVTDEIVAIDLASGTLWPYPRPLSLRAGTRDLLEPLVSLGDGPPPFTEPDGPWHFSPRALGRRSDRPATARLIVDLSRDPEGIEGLSPLTRADALCVLAENAFNFHTHGATGLQTLAAVVQNASCMRLLARDLPRAAAEVVQALTAADERASA